MNVPREHSQLASFTLVLCGLGMMIGMPDPMPGVAFIGLSCWILMISESLLHAKVQLEMSNALEGLRRKQEAEVQDLLYFLRDSQISSMPFESMDGAKRLCRDLSFPAMVLGSNHQIITANQEMHDLLGYQPTALNGLPAHVINDIVVMSRIGELCSRPPYVDQKAVISKYVYVHKSGKKILGQMDAHTVGLSEGFMVVFHPEDRCVMSYEDISHLTQN